MCANYGFTLDDYLKIHDLFHFPVERELPATDIWPNSLAPVLIQNRVKFKNYRLVPHWARDEKRFSKCYNARSETLLSKPTWKESAHKRRCVVPLSSFHEPVRSGPFAHHWISFGSTEPIFAAGVYDTWINPDTGEVREGFAIVTKEPSAQVEHYGHDRMPVLLGTAELQEWCESEMSPSFLQSMIQKSVSYDFEVKKLRPLKLKP